MAVSIFGKYAEPACSTIVEALYSLSAPATPPIIYTIYYLLFLQILFHNKIKIIKHRPIDNMLNVDFSCNKVHDIVKCFESSIHVFLRAAAP